MKQLILIIFVMMLLMSCSTGSPKPIYQMTLSSGEEIVVDQYDICRPMKGYDGIFCWIHYSDYASFNGPSVPDAIYPATSFKKIN